jgi:hypothetical protein
LLVPPLSAHRPVCPAGSAAKRADGVTQDSVMTTLVQVEKLDLADAATSPGPAAAAATGAPGATSPTAPASAAASAAASASTATSPGHFFADPACSDVFLVEHIKRRQADVGDFFLTEKDFLTRSGILGLDVRSRSSGGRGCSTCERQRHAGDSQYRQGLAPTASLRSLLRTRH